MVTRLPGAKSIRQAVRWARSRVTQRALILGYHRVADEPSDPFALCVSPENFAQQLDAVRRHGRPAGLGELVQAMARGAHLDPSVVVTFDDGYADVLTHAKPLLERARVPGTAFVIPGVLGEEFWWDALWRILRTPDRLPVCLRLPLPGVAFERTLSDGERDASRRQDLLFELHARLLPLSEEQCREALRALAAWAEVEAEGPSTPRALAPDQLVELAHGGEIEIGAHSHTHALLPALSVERQRSEVEASKTELERLIGRPVVSFSYPHGRASTQTAALVRGAGFERACTSRSDVVRRGSDLFLLPRFWVPNWNGARFSRWLARWLGSRREEGS